MNRNDGYHDHDKNNVEAVSTSRDGRYARTEDGRFYEAMPATADRSFARGHERDEDTDRTANRRAAKTGVTTFLLGLITGALATWLLMNLLDFGVNRQPVTVPTPQVQVEGQ